MLKIGRCLSRLSQQAQSAAGASQASRALLERYQEATCSAVSHAEPHSQRGFFTAFGLQQQSGAPMMESHGDAEEEDQRREDLNQHRGTPQDASEVHHSGEPKGVEAKADVDTETYQPGVRSLGTDVPAGHLKSDLSPATCSLVLHRRRDLTFRGDIKLSRNNHDATLQQLLKDRVAILFGVPDMGPVCSEQHVPGFLEKLDEIVDCGIDRVYCVSNASPADVAQWSQSVGMDKPKIEAWADEHGSFTRMLGLEASNPTESGTGSHRWAAITQDGILLKMRVEHDPTEVKETSADAMLNCWRYFKELESAK